MRRIELEKMNFCHDSSSELAEYLHRNRESTESVCSNIFPHSDACYTDILKIRRGFNSALTSPVIHLNI